jgi:hypothetical protein
MRLPPSVTANVKRAFAIAELNYITFWPPGRHPLDNGDARRGKHDPVAYAVVLIDAPRPCDARIREALNTNIIRAFPAFAWLATDEALEDCGQVRLFIR